MSIRNVLKKWQNSLPVCLTLAVLVCPMAVQAASLGALASVVGGNDASIFGLGPIERVDNRDSTGSILTGNSLALADASTFNRTMNLNATARARFGSLKVKAEASELGSQNYGGRSVATASFTDTLTIKTVSSQLSSNFGILHALIDLRGSMAATDSRSNPGALDARSISQFLFDVDASNTGKLLSISSIDYSPGATNFLGRTFVDQTRTLSFGVPGTLVTPGSFQFGLIPIDINVDFGFPLALSMSLTAIADVNGFSGTGASAVTDLSHSVYWGGITSITDTNGKPIDFTLSSESGQNYRNSLAPSSVPVPAAVWLMGSALLGLTPFARRKQKTPV